MHKEEFESSPLSRGSRRSPLGARTSAFSHATWTLPARGRCPVTARGPGNCKGARQRAAERSRRLSATGRHAVVNGCLRPTRRRRDRCCVQAPQQGPLQWEMVCQENNIGVFMVYSRVEPYCRSSVIQGKNCTVMQFSHYTPETVIGVPKTRLKGSKNSMCFDREICKYRGRTSRQWRCVNGRTVGTGNSYFRNLRFLERDLRLPWLAGEEQHGAEKGRRANAQARRVGSSAGRGQKFSRL